MERLPVGVKPLGRQVCHDDGEDAGNRHAGYASRVRTPGDRGQKEKPGQRVVLKHNLPDAAQIDVQEPHYA